MRFTIQSLFTIVLPLYFGVNIYAATDCMPISEATASRITDYVHDKFAFPVTTRVVIAKIDSLGSSCYTKLTLKTEGDGDRLQTILYLSPDQQFLTRELMDTT